MQDNKSLKKSHNLRFSDEEWRVIGVLAEAQGRSRARFLAVLVQKTAKAEFEKVSSNAENS